MDNRRITRLIFSALLALLVLAAAFVACWQLMSPQAKEGSKTSAVEISHLDGTSRDIELKTDAETLWDAMVEEDLVQGEDGQYGIWITAVDGETADETQGQYWVFTRDGQWVDTACDSTYIEDGQHYEFYIYIG